MLPGTGPSAGVIGRLTLSGALLGLTLAGGRPAAVDPLSSTVAPAPVAGALIRTVRVGPAPFALALDARRGHVFVVNNGRTTEGGSVAVLDAATGRVVRMALAAGLQESSGYGSQAVAVDSRIGRVFVLDTGKRPGVDRGSVVMLDAATGRVRGRTRVVLEAGSIAVDERSGRVVISGAGTTVLDSATGQVLRTLRIGGDPLALDGRTGRVFVVQGYDGVSVLDEGTGAVLRHDPLIGVSSAVAVDSRAGVAVVYGYGSKDAPLEGLISLLDTRTGRVRRIVSLGAGPRAYDNTIGIDGARGRAVVGECPLQYDAGPGPCDVTVLDTRRGRVLHTTALAATSLGVGVGPLAVDTRRGLAFVTTVAAGYDGFPAGRAWWWRWTWGRGGCAPRSAWGALPRRWRWTSSGDACSWPTRTTTRSASSTPRTSRQRARELTVALRWG